MAFIPPSWSAGQLAQANGSIFGYGGGGLGPPPPGAAPSTNQYAPVGSAAWAQQNHVDPQGVQSMLARGPWNSQQLDQAYAINPGLAAYMYREINPIAGQQFMQDHGFANAPGAQTMLNGAGRNFMMDYDPTYGAQARDAQGHRLMFGATTDGTPYSYEMRARGDPAFLRWQQTGQGAPPPGITMYSQFGGGAQPQQLGAANPGMPGMQAPGNPSAGLPQTPNVQPQTLGQIANGGGMMYAGGSPTFNENMGAGVPGGNMSIPAAPGNPYTLNIGSYLNPMMNYAMQQGDQSILNSQASAGLLNSGDTAKQLYGYGLGLGANNFNNAAGIAAGQQQFGAGLDQYDQQFAYNAQNADRNFALQSLLGEGQLGLGGATQQGWNDRYLAQLLSGNLGALGQAQGAGAIGGSNAINNAISQMIGSYLGGNALNSLGGLGGG